MVRARLVSVVAGVLGVSFAVCRGQEVRTSRPQTVSGERVLRVETTLQQPLERVWKAFATEEGLKCWIAPVVRLDLRTGGSLSTNYDKAATIGSPGTISLVVLNYVEDQEITFKVKLNSTFSERLQSEDGNLQEVVVFHRLPNGGTKVVSSMVGWRSGEEWDKAFEFFARGNEWSYKSLVKCFARGGVSRQDREPTRRGSALHETRNQPLR